MGSRLARHTSMRGRLALLLIALLVVPMSLVGLLAHRAMTDEARAGLVPDPGTLGVGETLQIREAALGFREELNGSLKRLSLRAARELLAGSRDPVARDLVQDSPAGALVFRIGARGQGAEAYSADAAALAALLVTSSRPFAGYAVLARPDGQPGLFQVAYEPVGTAPRDASKGGALALLDVAPPSGPGLLDELPRHSRLVRTLLLPDGTPVARSASSPAGHEPSPELAAADALRVLGTLGRRLAGTVGDDARDEDLPSHAAGDVAWAMQALRGVSGTPVACALVEAHRADLRGPDPGVPLGTRVRSLVGWIAVAGVLLALAIAFLAPRWIWSDIRQSTDSIFHSVERLRELVRRNSRALDEQSRVIRSLTASTSALKLSSQSIADTTRALAHSAEQSAWVSQSGNQKAELSQRAVLEVRDRVEQISVQMEELERRCGDIGKILGFIDHLSNETNTLSVNAAIQAVGAGSSGRQFSVVAGEIRKLADLALESTRDIQQLIEQIQESSETTLSATRDGCREVDKCLASFEELESAFTRILRWVEETTRGSHGIEQSTARQSESLKSVVSSIEELEQRAGETAGNFHEVVAAADELASLGADMNETWRVG